MDEITILSGEVMEQKEETCFMFLVIFETDKLIKK